MNLSETKHFKMSQIKKRSIKMSQDRSKLVKISHILPTLANDLLYNFPKLIGKTIHSVWPLVGDLMHFFGGFAENLDALLTKVIIEKSHAEPFLSRI